MSAAVSTPKASLQFAASPWVSGTRAEAYFGWVSCSGPIPDCEPEHADFVSTMLARLVPLAEEFGANWIVGYEIAVDPFAGQATVSGTLALLEPLFPVALR